MIEVHIPANFFYPDLPGGSLQYLRYGPYLRERGVRLNVYVIKEPHHEEDSLEVSGIRIRRFEVPERQAGLQELIFLAGKAMEAIGESPGKHCVHPLGTSAASPKSVLEWWKIRLKGVPVLFHYMMFPVKEPKPLFRQIRSSVWDRVCFSPYSKMLMCSRVMGRAYQAIGKVPFDKIHAIPNGIDLKVFYPLEPGKRKELRERLGLPVDDPLVLFVGSINPRKGVDLLVKAWTAVLSRFPRAKLVMVGSKTVRPTEKMLGSPSTVELYLRDVFDLIEALPDPESVILAGEVNNVRDYYQVADVFAFASHREGLPSVVLEAMGCGIPCVVSPFLGLPDDGEEYGVAGTHYVKTTHQPEDIAADVIRVLEDESLRTEMGAEAAQWIRENQDMEKAADCLAGVYRSLF